MPLFGVDVTLTWEAPTTNADGTPLTDLGGYKIYYGTASRVYSTSIDVGNVLTTTLTGIPNTGKWYFTATAYDTWLPIHNESVYSNEVSRTFTCIITSSAGPNGSISPLGSVVVSYGGNQTFTITANSGYIIDHILIDGIPIGIVNTYTFSNVTTNHSIATSFVVLPIDVYGLAITKAGTGSGTVTSLPSGINCGSACSYAYNENTVVTLTAIPNTSSIFTGWSGGGCTGTGTCVVTMDTEKTVTATFTPKTYTITATAGDGGSISPVGSIPVDYGANQTFTITPDDGYYIANVLIDGISIGSVNTYTFTNVLTPHTINANFTINTYNLAVTKAGAGAGTVISSPIGITCGSDCSEIYSESIVITLIAIANANSTFIGWSGDDCTGTGACTVTMNNAKTVIATFALKTYTITAATGVGGTIAPSGIVMVDYGANQTFTITPDTGYHIEDVIIDKASIGSVNTYTFSNVTTGHSVGAAFAIDVYNEGYIIDNGDTTTSHTGMWYISGGILPYGTNSLWSRNGTYTWRFTTSQTSNYELFMWWTCYSSRGKDIPVYIEYFNGEKEIYINQQEKCSTWNSIGIYPFAADTNYEITIEAEGTLTTCADAVMVIKK